MIKKLPTTNHQPLITNRGFTLIELLVVISIIGLLAGLLISNVAGIRERARDVARKSDLDQMKKALRMYYNDHNSYPTTTVFSAISGEFKDPNGTMVYMKVLPVDPSTQSSYAYYSGIIATPCTEGANDFRLVATLENKSDPGIGKSHSRCADGCGFIWSVANANEYVVGAD